MIELNARYDGKVIVPDAPLDLPANARVRISVEPIIASEPAKPAGSRSEFHDLIGLGLRSGPLNPNPRFPDDDALWDKSLEDRPE